ncbi:MAG: YdcF family protein [Cyclobacteriaceae bacterium]
MKRRLRRVAFGLLLFFSNPYLSNVALSVLETDPVLLDQEYTVGIVLSGMVEAGYDVPNQDQLNENFDRLMEAVKLYKDGKVRKILISGGGADILYPVFNEGKSLKELSGIMGVPDQDIMWEDKSRNTFENAQFTSDLLAEKEYSLVLVTSAFHMPRAKSCFEKAGLEVSVYPVDYKGRTDFKWKYMLPSSDGFQNWNIVLKEVVGLIMYRLLGYI